jgi:signal transduction histidine kinase
VRRSHRHRARHGPLFWRIYLNGLLLLALVAVALGAVASLYGGRMMPRPERFADFAARQVERSIADPGRLADDLRRARDEFGADLSVYRGEELLASNVEPPLPPLPPPERAALAHGSIRLHGRHWAFAALVPGGGPGAYLVLSGGWRPFSLARAASFGGAVLLALALASIPLARAIAAPLERLTEAARRLGRGDLTARAGFRGRGEVGDLARAFDEMAERLERLIRAERELLANVSHELRTPLSRIRVALELAGEGDPERARQQLAGIGADLAELDRLIEDVLTAARLEQGGALPLRAEPVEPGDLVRRAAEHFRQAASDRALALEVDAALPQVDGDPALLRRALDNLLDNARKYADGDAPVALSARAVPGGVVLEVADRGIGIDPADLPRLFTPFFRTDRSRARGTGGVGLGLALARRIAEAHGGTLEVESAPGQGTRVRLRLPARS